jgi:hypothetical protein
MGIHVNANVGRKNADTHRDQNPSSRGWRRRIPLEHGIDGQILYGYGFLDGLLAEGS